MPQQIGWKGAPRLVLKNQRQQRSVLPAGPLRSAHQADGFVSALLPVVFIKHYL